MKNNETITKAAAPARGFASEKRGAVFVGGGVVFFGLANLSLGRVGNQRIRICAVCSGRSSSMVTAKAGAVPWSLRKMKYLGLVRRMGVRSEPKIV